MAAALLIAILYVALVWLVFFRLKLIRFTIGWGVVSTFVGLHVLLIFLIGLRFVTPYSTSATVVQHTIQLVPRLTEPALVTDVLVKEDVPVKKGDPLFRFDSRPYEYKIQQVEAQLAEARQNVLVLKANVTQSEQSAAKANTLLSNEQFNQRIFDKLAKEGTVRADDVEKWHARVAEAQAAADEAAAGVEVARLRYGSEIGGVNTSVAALEAQLREARYYLDQTTLRAPEDGRVINLQVRPGMVSGVLRVGGIAAFVADADRYVLATFYQENLKYVKPGQPVEVSLDLYPGQIFTARVHSIWKASSAGQYLPSDVLPTFEPASPTTPQGQYAVRITLDGEDHSKFSIGAQGTAAIYTSQGAWAALRRISIRAHSWLNWLYPLNF